MRCHRAHSQWVTSRHRVPRGRRKGEDHLLPRREGRLPRLLGNADGFIVNEILGDGDDLRLRFSFALQLVDAPSDSAKEREFREVRERDYVKAVDATLAAIRKMVSEPQPAK